MQQRGSSPWAPYVPTHAVTCTKERHLTLPLPRAHLHVVMQPPAVQDGHDAPEAQRHKHPSPELLIAGGLEEGQQGDGEGGEACRGRGRGRQALAGTCVVGRERLGRAGGGTAEAVARGSWNAGFGRPGGVVWWVNGWGVALAQGPADGGELQQHTVRSEPCNLLPTGAQQKCIAHLAAWC